MTDRIVKYEEFYPLAGDPVVQLTKEVTHDGGRIERLDPYIPSPNELADARAATVATLTALVATRTAERDAALSDLQEANDSLAMSTATIEDQADLIAQKSATITEMTEQLAAANTRISLLVDSYPFDPMVLRVEAFRRRITADDWLWLETNFAMLASRLKEVQSVNLQAPELLSAIEAVKSHPACPIDSAEWTAILRPANRDESFVSL